MLTHTGIKILPLNDTAPSPVDLAVHMGRLCLYGGAIWFNLLSHSILVSWLVRSLAPSFENWAWALLHDAHETVTGDVPHPWKTDDMRERQKVLDLRIASYYKIDRRLVSPAAIKQADLLATSYAAYALGLRGYSQLQKEKLPTECATEPDESTRDLVLALADSPLNDPAVCTRGLLNSSIASMADAFHKIAQMNLEGAYDVVDRLVQQAVAVSKNRVTV